MLGEAFTTIPRLVPMVTGPLTKGFRETYMGEVGRDIATGGMFHARSSGEIYGRGIFILFFISNGLRPPSPPQEFDEIGTHAQEWKKNGKHVHHRIKV